MKMIKKFVITIMVAASLVPMSGVCAAENEQERADAAALDTHKATAALFTAILMGNSAQVTELIRQGVDVNRCDKTGYTPLLRAICVGSYDVVRLLIENGADVNQGVSVERRKDLPLGAAIELRNIPIIELLLNSHVHINADFDYGYGTSTTFLIVAVHTENSAIVRMLLDKGADVNKADSNGKTTLMAAIRENNMSIVEMLIMNGAHVDHAGESDSIYNALHEAVCRRDTPMIKMLLAGGADINNCYLRNSAMESLVMKLASQEQEVQLEAVRSSLGKQDWDTAELSAVVQLGIPVVQLCPLIAEYAHYYYHDEEPVRCYSVVQKINAVIHERQEARKARGVALRGKLPVDGSHAERDEKPAPKRARVEIAQDQMADSQPGCFLC